MGCFIVNGIMGILNITKSSTCVSPYMLTYGQEVVLLIEITVQSLRVQLQSEMLPEDYRDWMHINLDELDEIRAASLDHLIAQKRRVSRAFNKMVKRKQFIERDLVWKAILPFNLQDREFGKWSSNWEGPYLVTEVLSGYAYGLMDVNGKELSCSINGKLLKKYNPSI